MTAYSNWKQRANRLAKTDRVRHMMRYAAVTYLGIATSLASAPILAQTLGADGRGVLAGVFVVIQVMAWVSFLGLPTGLATQVERRDEISFWGVCWTGLIGIAAAAMIFAVAPILANNDPRIELGIRVVSPLLILSGISSTGEQIALLSGSVRTYNSMRVSTLVFPSLAIILLFLLGHLTVLTAFVTTLTGQLVAVAIGTVVTARHLRRHKRGNIPWNFSFRVWISSLFDSVGGRGDQMALTALSTAPVVGVYAIAATCANAASGIAQALALSSMKHFIQASKSGEKVHMGRLVATTVLLTGVTSVATLAVIHYFGTAIFGPDFSSLVPVLAVLLIAGILQDVWRIRASYENANERAGALAISSATGIACMAASITLFSISGSLSGVTMAVSLCIMCSVRLIVHITLIRFKTRN